MHWICYWLMLNLKRAPKQVILFPIRSKWCTLGGFLNQWIKCEAPKFEIVQVKWNIAPLELLRARLCSNEMSANWQQLARQLNYVFFLFKQLNEDTALNRLHKPLFVSDLKSNHCISHFTGINPFKMSSSAHILGSICSQQLLQHKLTVTPCIVSFKMMRNLCSHFQMEFVRIKYQSWWSFLYTIASIIL